MHGLIHRQIEGTQIEDLEFSVFLRRFQIQPQAGGPFRVGLRTLLEHGHDSRLSLAYAFGNELGCQNRFPGSRRPGYEYAIALAHAAAEHLVQLSNTEAKAPMAGRILQVSL